MIDSDAIAQARRSLGRQLAALRRAAGFRSQAAFAPSVGYSRSTIANVETGRQVEPRRFWQRCDELLDADGALLGGYDQLQALIRREQRLAGRAQAERAAVWKALPPGLPVTPAFDEEHDAGGMAAMQSFRAADGQVGGGHLYPAVMRYLQTEVASCLFGSTASSGGPTIFAWAAAVTEMAGWMAHDAGHDAVASQHFHRALDLVRLGADAQLGAHILGSMSHLARQHGRPDDAVHLAHAGRRALSDQHNHGEMLARLLALEARAHASRGDTERATQLLTHAERALDGPTSNGLSPWISRFDHGSLANEAASGFLSLGRFEAAQRQAETILSLRPATRTRSRVLGQLLLANSLIMQHRPDEACSIVEAALASIASLSSYPVHTRLAEVGKRLVPFAASTVVATCMEHLRYVTAARPPSTQWLAPEEPAE